MSMNFFKSLSKKTSPFTINIYCDGDSTTAYPDNYTLGIKSYLESNIENLTANVTNVAVSGRQFSDMLANLDTNILANDPDIITISTLLNDQFNQQAGIYKNNIDTYIRKILSHVNSSTGKTPLLLLMTDNIAGQNLDKSYARPYDTPISGLFANTTQLSVYDDLMSVYNLYRPLPTIWFHDRFKTYYNLGYETSNYFQYIRSDDKVHPNKLGYDEIDSPKIYPILKSIAEQVRIFK